VTCQKERKAQGEVERVSFLRRKSRRAYVRLPVGQELLLVRREHRGNNSEFWTRARVIQSLISRKRDKEEGEDLSGKTPPLNEFLSLNIASTWEEGGKIGAGSVKPAGKDSLLSGSYASSVRQEKEKRARKNSGRQKKKKKKGNSTRANLGRGGRVCLVGKKRSVPLS